MCTATVITRSDGYLIGMNRDERLSRGLAAPPTLVETGHAAAIYPRDGVGGTWIAANNHGVALALLNWNDVSQPDGEKVRSRGEVIPPLTVHASSLELEQSLAKFDLQGLWPFRLVGVFPDEKTIGEWCWDTKRLDFRVYKWAPRHWFSSSLSDAEAATGRGAVCDHAWKEADAGSAPWLRRLHASHANGPGPFSTCVHREEVGTLSYTEIRCGAQEVEYVYFGDAPCRRPTAVRVDVRRTEALGNTGVGSRETRRT